MTTGYFSCSLSICRHCGLVKSGRFEGRVGRFPVPVTCFLLPVTRSSISEIDAPPLNVHDKCGIPLLLADERWGARIFSHAGSGVADFRKLRVWQKAHELAVEAHRVTARMRGVRSAPLRDQLTRAGPHEFARFVQYSLASVSELEGHIQLARDLELITDEDFRPFLSRIVDVRKMLHGLLKRLKAASTGNR
jgi:hypothetical protein